MLRFTVSQRNLMKLVLLCTSFLFLVTYGSIASCKPNPVVDSDFFFPTQKEGVNPHALARQGTLILKDGYLRLQVEDLLLIWPHGYSLKTDREIYTVFDNLGNEVARVGDWLYLGGGYASGDLDEQGFTDQKLPENAYGPFWIISEVTAIPPVTFSDNGNETFGEIRTGWQQKTISEVGTLLGKPLPLPGYLPVGYEVKEIYYREKIEPSVFADIIVLISDQPVSRIGDRYATKLTLTIGWNRRGISRALEGEQITATSTAMGVLQEESRGYILWWPCYGPFDDPSGSTMKFYAGSQFTKDELIKIASSIPATP